MSIRYISGSGCDDSNDVRIELTDEQAKFASRLFEAVSAASRYSCEPRIYIGEAPERDWESADLYKEVSL